MRDAPQANARRSECHLPPRELARVDFGRWPLPSLYGKVVRDLVSWIAGWPVAVQVLAAIVLAVVIVVVCEADERRRRRKAWERHLRAISSGIEHEEGET